ncbi:ATPase AAA-type core [Arabidopsis thaliana x Arabidopsis arenosa]|uniref:ATPase AAA-type core n=1 Tax=Arabidopsis thaliana x Arabidopsis arenosa TaxID=1240361 RepID=A0A8T2C253_9BRAS|nr:ATPase AAA-type core [Arabidopsis thaliana x Arabidopsis arenosa]
MEHDNEDKKHIPIDEEDIAILKTHALGPYAAAIRKLEKEIKEREKKINDICGVEESDMGLAPRSQWDLIGDEEMLDEEQNLRVFTCTAILNPNSEDARYVIQTKNSRKYVASLSSSLSPTDVEEGMRVGVCPEFKIMMPLPPRFGYTTKMFIVEDTPDVTYNDIGGCTGQIQQIREVVEWPMLHPEKFVKLGLDPPRGVLCYGPPGTGKTLLAKAVANRTAACFIRVIGTELVHKCSVDAIGGARVGVGPYEDSGIHRTMLEIVNQLDGFDQRGNIKVLMATNRPDSLDPALLRLGRLDRKLEFGLPDLQGRIHIFKIHTRSMNCDKHIRYELLARLCPNTSGADIRSVCTEAGMFAIRARRKTVTEQDFLDAVTKVVKSYHKFSATPTYMVYN